MLLLACDLNFGIHHLGCMF